MTIQFSFNVILLIAGIIIGILAAIVLFAEKQNRAANRYLAGLVLICVGTLLHNFLIASGIYNQKPNLYFLPVLLSFGIGPLLYLFINRLIFLNPVKKSVIFLHLLPLLIQFSFYLFCFLQNGDVKYEIYSLYYEPIIKPVQILGNYISVSIYIYLCFKEISFYKQQLNDFYSNSDKIALGWLHRLLYVFMFYYLLSVVFVIVSYSFHISEDYFPSDFIRCIIIFTIAAYAVKQPTLSGIQNNIHSIKEDEVLNEEQVVPEKIDSDIATQIIGTDKPTQPKEVNADLLQKIIDTVETEQLYLNEELTIADLAKKLGYSSKTISHNINNGLQKSFSLFINEYRVNLFKEKKASGKYDQLSIMGLAYDCGFNSKSTFNRIFKEITGSSPKEQKSNGE